MRPGGLSDTHKSEPLSDETNELRLITDSIPALISYIDANERIRRVNRTYRNLLGRDTDLIGRTVREAAGEEHYAIAKPYMDRALRGETVQFESQIRADDGSIRDIALWYTPDVDPGGHVRGVVVMVQDITDRKRAEHFVTGQKRVLELISENADLRIVLESLCRLIEASTTTRVACSILLLDRNRERLLFGAAPSLPDDYNQAINGLQIGPDIGTCGRAAYFGRESVSPDIATDPFWAPFVHLALPHGLRACWSTPIVDGTGGVLGALTIYYPAPGEPDPRDRDVVAAVARMAAVAIARKRADEDLGAARNQASSILESITDAFYALDSNWQFSYVNQAAERMLMRRREDLLGHSIWEEFAPAVDTIFWHEYHRGRRDGVAVHFEAFYAPLECWFDVHAYPSAGGLSVYFQDITERKTRESRDAFLVRVDDATRRLTNAGEITQTAARLLGDYMDVNRCAYADVEDDQDTFNLTGDYNRAVPSIVGRYRFLQFGADCLRLMREGKPYIVEDSETDPRTDDVRASYRKTEIRSVICVPLLKGGRFVAAMAVHQVTPRQWQPAEVELVQLVASRCWESIERTRVTRELAEREQRLRLAQQVGRIGSFEWLIPEGRIIWTPELETLYGIAEGTFEGNFDGWRSRVVPEDADRVEKQIAECIEQRSGELVYEFRAVLPDNTHRWLRGHSQFLYDDSGVALRMVGVNIDIEAEKRAEQERRLLLAREQEARQTAELLNRVGPLLVTELDSQRLAQRVTDLATQLVGAAFGALFHNVTNEAGESYLLYTLSGIPREAFANFPMPRSTAVFGPTFRGEGVVRSDDITKDPRYGKNAPYHGMPKGHLPVRSYLAVPVISRTGDVLGGLFFGDSRTGRFTEQHEQLVTGIAAQAAVALDNAQLFAGSERAKAALEASNAELRMANLDLEQFAFAAAHDLQEPLRMVTSYTQLLERELPELEEKTRQHMHFIVSAAKRMSLLLQDLLAYTEASREPDEAPRSVNLQNVVKSALSNLAGTVAENSASIHVEPLPELLGRDAHFVQLFQNLLSNALKYRRPNVPPEIRISAERSGSDWLIRVQDNGQGIAKQYHSQIFGVFKRLHGKDIPGTGIGLAICHRVVERAGGRIWVESEGPNQGSTFCFTLPAAS